MLKDDLQGGSNYDSWIFKLNLTLKSKGIYQIATGVKIKPEGDESSTADVYKRQT